MYIKTDGYGLINIKYCQGIEIYQVPDGYKLRAIPSADSKVYSRCFGTIAVFENEEDANYIVSKIFECLARDEPTLDADPENLLSILWDKIRQRLQSFSPYEALDEMRCSMSGKHEVIITYPLRHDADDNRILPSEKKRITEELNKTVKTKDLIKVLWCAYDPESDIPF